MNKRALLLPLVLAACSNTQLQPDETETFTVNILGNGTKLFHYHLDSPGQAARARLVFNAEEPLDHNTAPDMQTYAGADEPSAVEDRVLNLLEQKLATTGYCREGFVLSDKQITPRQADLKGECREAASADDQRTFAKP